MLPIVPGKLPPQIDYIAHLPMIGKANRALATLEGLFYGIPNPNVLLSPIITQEAVLSSKIEGTQADLEDVLKFDAGESSPDPSRNDDIQEIINYRKALNQSKVLLKNRPFCLRTLLALHGVLMDSVRGHDKLRGRFRTTQNWIGKEGTPIEQAVFVPPSPLHLQDYLNQWEKYWHSDAPDVLVQLAIVHAQFEILHPFVDGNGRLGRMIIPLFLYEKKILSRPCFYLSAYFEARRDEYIGRLRALSQPGYWDDWCAFFLEGVAVHAEAYTAKARAIQDLYERLKIKIIELTHSQFAVPLLDFMFTRPIFRSSDVAKSKGMPSNPMVAMMLGTLRKEGILRTIREASGRKPYVLALAELINLCEGKAIM